MCTKNHTLFNGKKIFYLFDPPHLITAVRNNLNNYDFHFIGKLCLTFNLAYKKLAVRCDPKLTSVNSHHKPTFIIQNTFHHMTCMTQHKNVCKSKLASVLSVRFICLKDHTTV